MALHPRTSDESEEPRRFLVVIQLKDTKPARLQWLVPSLQDVLTRISIAPYELAFRAITADLFGYVITSKRSAPQIAATIESPGSRSIFAEFIEPFLAGDDHVLVVELGHEFSAGAGFTRLGTGLQRH